MKRPILGFMLAACLVNCGSDIASALEDEDVVSESLINDSYPVPLFSSDNFSIGVVSEKNNNVSLVELCESAIEHSPRLQAKKYNITAHEARVKLKKFELLPNLNMNSNYTSSDDTDLMRLGARVSWGIDLSKLLGRDIKFSKLKLLSAEEEYEREKIWVLNDIGTKYTHLVAQEMRAQTYSTVIDLLEGISSSDEQFMVERELKIIKYNADLTRILNSAVDLKSEITGLAYGDPYGSDLDIDISSLRYRELPLDLKAVLRRAVRERMRPDVLELQRRELMVKMSTRQFQPRAGLGVSQWVVKGIAGQGYDGSSLSWGADLNLLINPISKSAKKAESRAELNFTRANINSAMINLINGTRRAYDKVYLAEENVLSFDMIPVNFSSVMSSVPVDRQLFDTLDLYLQKDLTRIRYLSDYFTSLYNLNRHVMLDPLREAEYHVLSLDNSMPQIFEHLELPSAVYERHVSELISD